MIDSRDTLDFIKIRIYKAVNDVMKLVQPVIPTLSRIERSVLTLTLSLLQILESADAWLEPMTQMKAMGYPVPIVLSHEKHETARMVRIV